MLEKGYDHFRGFQFLMVRLKEASTSSAVVSFTFQFLMVRLKVVQTKENEEQKDFSIPYGSIKR